EVCGHGDDGVGDLFAKVLFGVVLELHQNASRDFLGSVRLIVNFGFPVGTHVTLDRGNGAFWVVDSLTLGDITGQHFATLGKCDHRWGGASTFGVGDNGWVATF